jgi:hypothetical protein
MASEKSEHHLSSLGLWVLSVILVVLAVGIFAPFSTCEVCDGAGSVNHGMWDCPCCHGSKRLGYGLMRWREWRLTQPLSDPTAP